MNREIMQGLDSLLGVSFLALLVVAVVAGQANADHPQAENRSEPARAIQAADPGEGDAVELNYEFSQPDHRVTIRISLDGDVNGEIQKFLGGHVVAAVKKEADL